MASNEYVIDATSTSETAAIEAFEIEGEENTEMEEELVSDYESVPCEREVSKAPSTDLPSKEILKQFKYKGTSLYEHITRILEYLITTRPGNTIDYFDQYSRAIKDPKGIIRPSHYLDSAFKLTRMFGKLYSITEAFILSTEAEEEEEGDGKVKKDVTRFIDYTDYFREMGVGLPKHEIYQIDCAIRHLAEADGISKARFWGKIFGTERSYIVAECDLTHEEIERRLRREHERMYEEGEEEEESIIEQPPVFGFSSLFKHNAEEEEEIVYKKLYNYRMPPLPLPKKQKKEKMRKEDIGEGTNKKVFYVCHEPGGDWVMLPDVLPEQIVAARNVRKYFKGFLSAEVNCYPPFPGKEREYLRAQIARITAGTHISPIGYYQFGNPDEMNEMEGEEQTGLDLVINLDYETIPYQDLLNTSFWVHHVANILGIGRTTYYEPPKALGEEMEEEEPVKTEDAEGKKSYVKEEGPPLLTPISEDLYIFGTAPWTIKGTSQMIPGSGPVGITSNLWPGAFCISKERQFENIYIGWGLKTSGEGFSPRHAPFPLPEYNVGPEIMEADDPTPEEEEEWRKLHEAPPLPIFRGEMEEGEEEHGPYYSEPESADV